MHRIATAITLAAAMAFIPAMTPVAQAQPNKVKNPSNLAIPVSSAADSANQFTGTFTLQRFARDGNNVVAIGVISGTATNAANGAVTTGVQTVSFVVTPSTVAGPEGITIAAVCPILHLDLGPLNLNLLGLVVHLNQIVLDITAVSGAGNLLGNLLCAVAGLLDNPGGLAALLNQILAILAGL